MDAANTDYDVYIKDVTIGRTEKIPGTSNGGKELKININTYFTANHSYELWVTLKDANEEDKQGVLIDSETSNKICFVLNFESTFSSGDKNSEDTITLKAA